MLRASLIGFSALVLIAGVCSAQTTTTSPASQEEIPTHSMFPKGMWAVDLYGGAFNSYEHGDETVSQGVVAADYYFAERHCVRMELVGYSLDNTLHEDDALAVGANLGLRYHFLESGRVSLFFEGVAGFFQADHEFPVGGTNFNFDLVAGLGATFKIKDNLHLIAGARYLHISNAQIKGVDENPSFNGIGGYLGLLFTF